MHASNPRKSVFLVEVSENLTRDQIHDSWEDSSTMRTRVSKKGQVVIPQAVREELQLRPGEPLDIRVERGRIILTPNRKRFCKPRILRDPVTGLPVLAAGRNQPRLTSSQVAEVLIEFP
jgi:AbrB family looped-hinge helix DNA binding protein